MSEAFDPTKACPVTKNAWCSTTDCPLYNTELEQCSLWKRDEAYQELSGTISGAETDDERDLGQIFRDVTVWVDKACVLKYGETSSPSINVTVESGRVGTPIVFKDIWVQKIFITTTETTKYIVTGNG